MFPGWCRRVRWGTNCDAETTRHSHLACYAAANAWMLDRKLTRDPATEEFIGDGEANRMRSRAVREPWDV